jgi:hypothetical protein
MIEAAPGGAGCAGWSEDLLAFLDRHEDGSAMIGMMPQWQGVSGSLPAGRRRAT